VPSLVLANKKSSLEKTPMSDYDATKWNASCDLLHEMIVRPNAEMRGVIRDELCCHELNAARAEVLQFIKGMRK
jgi:hypothetical protein